MNSLQINPVTSKLDLVGGGAAQTPWTSNIDAAGYDLSNVGKLYATEYWSAGSGGSTAPIIDSTWNLHILNGSYLQADNFGQNVIDSYGNGIFSNINIDGYGTVINAGANGTLSTLNVGTLTVNGYMGADLFMGGYNLWDGGNVIITGGGSVTPAGGTSSGNPLDVNGWANAATYQINGVGTVIDSGGVGFLSALNINGGTSSGNALDVNGNINTDTFNSITTGDMIAYTFDSVAYGLVIDINGAFVGVGGVNTAGNVATSGIVSAGTQAPQSLFKIAPPTTGYTTGGPYSMGQQFTVLSPITVTRLGRMYPTGQTHNHDAALWSTASTTVPLASGTILASSTSDADSFKWVNITPVVLVPGVDYSVVTNEDSSTLDTWKTNYFWTYADTTPYILAGPVGSGKTMPGSVYRSTGYGYPSTLTAYNAGFNTAAIGFTVNGVIQTGATSVADNFIASSTTNHSIFQGPVDISGGLSGGPMVTITQNHSYDGSNDALRINGYLQAGGFRINGADGINSLYAISGGPIGFLANDGQVISFGSWTGHQQYLIGRNGSIGMGGSSISTDGAFTNATFVVTPTNIQNNSPQTVVNCSTSGTVTYSQPEQGVSYKKVVIYCAAALGTAVYTFPTAFTNTPAIVTTNGLGAALITSLSTTAATVTGATSTGFLFIEGY